MSDEILNRTNDNTEGSILDILGKLLPKDAPQKETYEKSPIDGGVLSSLLQNPEIMGRLPEIISLISPMIGNLGSSATPVSKPAVTHTPSHSSEAQNRAALLCALKPYLKKERRDAVDYMIKLSRLGDILKSL